MDWDFNDDEQCDEGFDSADGEVRIARRGNRTVFAGSQILFADFKTEALAAADFAEMVRPFLECRRGCCQVVRRLTGDHGVPSARLAGGFP